MLNRSEYAGRNHKHIKNYRFWQEGNDAQQIYLKDYFEQKLEYIHQNPVRAGFVNRGRITGIAVLVIMQVEKVCLM
ncbi:MAG: transposase [Bacteroidetes bacterium]|nr:transposase [Bacteroidota bacterium]